MNVCDGNVGGQTWNEKPIKHLPALENMLNDVVNRSQFHPSCFIVVCYVVLFLSY